LQFFFDFPIKQFIKSAPHIDSWKWWKNFKNCEIFRSLFLPPSRYCRHHQQHFYAQYSIPMLQRLVKPKMGAQVHY
jgi:hypothetical protein